MKTNNGKAARIYSVVSQYELSVNNIVNNGIGSKHSYSPWFHHYRLNLRCRPGAFGKEQSGSPLCPTTIAFRLVGPVYRVTGVLNTNAAKIDDNTESIAGKVRPRIPCDHRQRFDIHVVQMLVSLDQEIGIEIFGRHRTRHPCARTRTFSPLRRRSTDQCKQHQAATRVVFLEAGCALRSVRIRPPAATKQADKNSTA